MLLGAETPPKYYNYYAKTAMSPVPSERSSSDHYCGMIRLSEGLHRFNWARD